MGVRRECQQACSNLPQVLYRKPSVPPGLIAPLTAIVEEAEGPSVGRVSGKTNPSSVGKVVGLQDG